MKKVLLFIVLTVSFMVWLNSWIKSGQMDQFISQHQDPTITPKVLYGIAEFYRVIQDSKSSNYYYRWLIQDYPDFQPMDKVLWYMGQSYEEIGQKPQAIEQYQILIDSYTATKYGSLAQARYWQIK